MIRSRENFEPLAPMTLGTAWMSAGAPAGAESLFRLIARRGETVESLRQLVGISLEERRVLEGFAAKFPELTLQVKCAIAFRQNVAEEFERLISQENVRAVSIVH